jgi:hypothetical protein
MGQEAILVGLNRMHCAEMAGDEFRVDVDSFCDKDKRIEKGIDHSGA